MERENKHLRKLVHYSVKSIRSRTLETLAANADRDSNDLFGPAIVNPIPALEAADAELNIAHQQQSNMQLLLIYF